MTPEKWLRVKQVYLAVADTPPDSRHAILHDACGGDDALELEVLALLAENTDTLLKFPPAFEHAITVTPGTVLGNRYRIDRQIGRGGFGVVYLARDSQLFDRAVVVKLLHEYIRADPWVERKFNDEIKAVARIDHPGVVGALDTGSLADGRRYFVMQYVEGETLLSLMSAGLLPFDRVAFIFRQIGQALSAAHQLGIIHRDLKPGNIMLQNLPGGAQYVRLIDFGIASLREAQDSRTSARLAGTLAYIAPEQLDGKASPATDIWALGAIAYELLTGRLPFPAENVLELPALQRRGLQLKPRDARPDIPPSAANVIERALSYLPADRPGTALKFGDELAAALGDAEPPVSRRPPSHFVCPLNLGDYQVLAAIGSDRMGELYQARDTRANQPVLIKLLSPEVVGDVHDVGKRAHALAQIKHPNILQIHAAGEYDGAPYLASEWLEGETLRYRLESHSALAGQAIGYARQIALGLAFAHEHEVIHGDLRTEDLLVTKEGHIKICNFGFGAAADPRSDVFGLGAILREMLSGKEPSPELDRILRRCLEVRPEDRFQSARDVLFALEGIDSAMRIGPRFIALYAALAACTLLSAAFLGGRLLPRTPVASTFTQLTTRQGAIENARFSPDGKTVVYAAAWDGAPFEIFSGRPESQEYRSLGIFGTSLFAISNSGDLALSLRHRVDNSLYHLGTLARVPLAGGAPREVMQGVQEADWSPNGKSFAIIHLVAGENRLEFPVGKVLYRSATRWISNPRVSPSGDQVAYLDHQPRSDEGFVAVVDLQGNRRRLTADLESVWGLAWRRPRTDEIWFTASEKDGNKTVRSVKTSGAQRVVLASPGNFILHDIALDGQVLLSEVIERDSVEFYAPGESRYRDLGWFGSAHLRDLSADGTTIIFEDGRGSATGAYLRKTDGSPAVRLGDGSGGLMSPDGKWVLCWNAPAWSILPVGAGDAVPLSSPGLEVTSASWMPDSKRVLLAAKAANQSAGLYVQDFVDGRLRGAARPVGGKGINQIPGPLTAPRASPDGKFAVGLNDRQKLLVYPLDGGEPRAIPGMEFGDLRGWASDGRIYVEFRPHLITRVFLVDIRTGHRELWKELMPPDPAGIMTVFGARVTPDGKAYAYGYGRKLSQLFLVDGLR